MNAELNALYQDILREHQKDPRNFGIPETCSCTIEKLNPVCGDRVCVGLAMDGEIVKEVHFEGEGCSISQSSASIMTEVLSGITRSEALAQVERFRSSLVDATPPPAWDSDVDALMGVRAFPVRVKCALIAWTAAKECLSSGGSSPAKGVRDV